MDHSKDIESTLNALLLNASELQDASNDPIADAELSYQQKHLLDTLLSQWNHLNELDREQVLKIENKVMELAKKNLACLREVSARPTQKRHPSSAAQLDFSF